MVKTRRVNQAKVQGTTEVDSDDDFMSPPPKEFRYPKRKREVDNNNVIKKHKGKLQKGKPKSVNNRNPPKVIVDELPKLNGAQKAVVRRIGFQHVLDLIIKSLPLKLGYWLVDNYDAETNTLCIGDRKLLVTREAVHEVYGFPLGEIQIKSQKKASTEDVIVQEFQSQFSADLKRLRVRDVIPKMLEDKEGSRRFMINFLVLVVSILIGAPGVGTVNQKFLPSIIDEKSVRGLDWCSYTIQCLNESKKAWNRWDKNCIFTGPLTFLVVFYVSCTIVEGEKITRTQPLMVGWTTLELKNRQKQEENEAKFGKVKMADGVKYVIEDEAVESLKKKGERILKNKAAKCKERIIKETQLETNEDVIQKDIGKDDSDRCIKDFAEEAHRRFSMISTIKSELEDWLKRGLSRFPDSEELLNYSREKDTLFGLLPARGTPNKEKVDVATTKQASRSTLEVELPFDMKVPQVTKNPVYLELEVSGLNCVKNGEIRTNADVACVGKINLLGSGGNTNIRSNQVIKKRVEECVPELEKKLVKVERTNQPESSYKSTLIHQKGKAVDDATVAEPLSVVYPRSLNDDAIVAEPLSVVYPRSLNDLLLAKLRARREVHLPAVSRLPFWNEDVQTNARLTADERSSGGSRNLFHGGHQVRYHNVVKKG